MAAASTRLCIGCRQTAGRDALLRFVLMGDPPELVPDIRRRQAGRGASTHARYRCLEKAVAGGGFQRAFRRKLSVSAPELARWARGQYRRRVDGLLQAAFRSGQVALGTDRVREALSGDRLAMLVVAEDAAGRRDELMEAASRLGSRCVVFGDKHHLGTLFGRPELGVVGVLDGRFAAEVLEATEHERELAEEA